MNKTEKITAKLIRREEGAKRVLLVFDDPRHPGEGELKFSIFPPKEGEPALPSLSLNQYYEFTAEHVPTGDGKFYHNVARVNGKGSQYAIKPVSAPFKDVNAPTRLDTPPLMDREDYWRAKDERDKAREKRELEREVVIVRQACTGYAATAVAASAATGNLAGTDKGVTVKDLSCAIQALARELEEFAWSVYLEPPREKSKVSP
ncbi:MAG: hypothetical protein M0R66_01165 [Candidatus Omnitrophica bacterium]|nr:hypothetical protein [Candidatus Omnitrophota bacterium]